MEQDADPFDLRRFVDAQAPVIEGALSELRAGRKRTHWMWFVFPQIEGLGFSSMAKRYAIRSPAEARAYLNHPVLGERLRECVRLVVATSRPIAEVFGHPDDLKFRSCVTLFAAAAPDEAVFSEALRACGDGATRRRSKSLRCWVVEVGRGSWLCENSAAIAPLKKVNGFSRPQADQSWRASRRMPTSSRFQQYCGAISNLGDGPAQPGR